MSHIETEDMDLAEHLKKKIIDFFKYKSNQSILSEILAYMTYKATKIKLFKFNNYLIIAGNDGGISDDNKNVLMNTKLGLSTDDNISYFGAGSRTAAKQWTEENGGEYFGIIDNETQIYYKLGGILGLQLVTSELSLLEGLELEDNYSYWVLPWNGKLEDNSDEYKAYFSFMLNKRLNSDMEFYYLGEKIVPRLDLFNTKKEDTFQHFKCKANIREYRSRKTDGSPDFRGCAGRKLIIKFLDENNEIIKEKEDIIYKPGKITQHGLIDLEDEFDEDVNFSYEFLKIGKTDGFSGEISTRRDIITDYYFPDSKPGSIHGVRFLMDDNFITNDEIGKVDKWGGKNTALVHINLNKRQYKQFARPEIKRTQGWEISYPLRELIDKVYKFVTVLQANEYIDSHRIPTPPPPPPPPIDMEHYRSHNDIICNIQKLYRHNVFKNNIIKQVKSKIETNEKNKVLRERAIEEWTQDQKKYYGSLYIWTNESMTKKGIEKFGFPIFKIGKSTSIINRMNNYKSQLWEGTDTFNFMKFENVYDIDRAENDWKISMNNLGWNLKDKQPDVTGTEFYVASIDNIKQIMNEKIEYRSQVYKNELKMKKIEINNTYKEQDIDEFVKQFY